MPVREYVDALAREFDIRGTTSNQLSTIYLGGGTPSKLGADGIAQLLTTIRARFTIAAGAEITVEANPEDVTESDAAAWLAAGVNRLSLGAQSFEPRVLEWMHRTHSAADIAQAVNDSRRAGFTNVSLDLIFALPDVLGRVWSRDIDAVLALDPEHVSVYGLTIEPATPLGRWRARGEVAAPADDRWADEFLYAHEHLERAGYEHYEVSNYGRPGMRSRHNEGYWNGVPYIGAGPAAHGFDGSSRRWNVREYAPWLAQINAGRDPVEGSELLASGELLAERVYLGLRSSAGLVLELGDSEVVPSWIHQQWGVVAGGHGSRRLILNAQGWLRLDSLAAALTALRSR